MALFIASLRPGLPGPVQSLLAWEYPVATYPAMAPSTTTTITSTRQRSFLPKSPSKKNAGVYRNGCRVSSFGFAGRPLPKFETRDPKRRVNSRS